jgi:hypothetical protein
MAVVIAYDMYKECLLEARAHEFFKFDEQQMDRATKQALSFYDFRPKLSIQALAYAPENQYYPGDKIYRVVTQMSKERRRRGSGKEAPCFLLHLKQSPKSSSGR